MANRCKENIVIVVRQSFVGNGETLTIGIVERSVMIPRYAMATIDAVGNVLDCRTMENHPRFFDAFDSFDGRWSQLERCGYQPIPGSFHRASPLGLYLDDVFLPSFLETDTYWMYAPTVQRAAALIERYGVPDIISFDHDLGKEYILSGHDLAKLLVQKVQDGHWVLPRGFDFTVHSSNFEGRANIEGLLNPFLEQWRSGRLQIDSDIYHGHESHTQLGESP